jgi:Flp pilus assembly protein TadD
MCRILLINPIHIETLNNLGVIELAAGRSEEALQHLDKVLQIEPGNGKALYYKALICIQLKKKEDALALLNTVGNSGNIDYSGKAKETFEYLTNANIM